MELNKNLIDEVLAINWFENCGNSDKTVLNMDCVIINEINKVEKNLNACRWENICLEACNQLTSYLVKNNPQAYNTFWNVGVREIKSSVLPNVINKIQDKCIELCLPENTIDYVKMDIVSMIMVLSYREYFQSNFYEEMLLIYKNGFFPCGWKGKFLDGKFEIY